MGSKQGELWVSKVLLSLSRGQWGPSVKSIGPYWAQMSSIGLRSDEGMSVVGWWGLLMLSRGHYGSIILGTEPFKLRRAHSGWVGSSWDHGSLVGLSAQFMYIPKPISTIEITSKKVHRNDIGFLCIKIVWRKVC